MNDNDVYTDGFDEFSKMLEEFGKKTEPGNVVKVLEIGAKEFISDVRALPKPRSRMSTPGYTHLLDTVTYEKLKTEVITGWGKYYGPMVENGTAKMRGVAHMKPTFERNSGKYYSKMQKALFG